MPHRLRLQLLLQHHESSGANWPDVLGSAIRRLILQVTYGNRRRLCAVISVDRVVAERVRILADAVPRQPEMVAGIVVAAVFVRLMSRAPRKAFVMPNYIFWTASLAQS
jgi:hypothetical protein